MTLPVNFQSPSGKSWRSAETGKSGPNIDIDRKVKTFSPNALSRKKGHRKSQSLGNK